MKADKFFDFCEKYFDNLFKEIFSQYSKKIVNQGLHFGYTNFGKKYISENHYIFELIGIEIYKNSNISISSKKKAVKLRNIDQFFYNEIIENAKVGFKIENESSGESSIVGPTFVSNFDKELYNLRIDIPIPCISSFKDEDNNVISYPNNTRFSLISDVTIIQIKNSKILYRHIPVAIISNRRETLANLNDFLNRQIHSLANTNYLPGVCQVEDLGLLTFCKQLTSLSNEIVDENLLDAFLLKNKEYFLKALGYNNLIAQANLKWIIRSENEPYLSKPDYLMVNSNRTFDILDLKTGAIKYKSITRGKKGKDGIKTRLRFVDYVEELMSQLEEYRSYFEYSDNCKFAQDKYNIGFNKNELRLIGVVGNYNTFNKLEVDVVMKKYHDKFNIISYADIVSILKSQIDKKIS